jgi:hypothetical protein
MERISLGENNSVLVRAAGDVCIRGWDQPDLQALCDRGRLVHTQQENGVVYIVSKSDLCISVPFSTAVRVEHISGDAYISGLGGRLDVLKVGGDLAVERCAQMDAAVVGGDLLLRDIAGAVTIQKVGGDLTGETLSGGLTVEQVGGSASFQAGIGALRLRAGGDLKFYLPTGGSEEVTLKAGGDIEIYVDSGFSARLELSSGAHDIEIDVADQRLDIEQEAYTGTLSDGQRMVRARAGGDIRMSDDDWDEDDLGDDFDDLAEQWDDFSNDLEEEEGDRIADIEDRVRRRAEEAARRAEERVREAMERVERQNRRRQDVFSRFGIRWGNFWPNTLEGKKIEVPDIKIPAIHVPSIDMKIPEINIPAMNLNPFGAEPPETPAPPSAPVAPVMPEPASPEARAGGKVSNEERMQVLKMLREHKITIEEADELLRALGGE